MAGSALLRFLIVCLGIISIFIYLKVKPIKEGLAVNTDYRTDTALSVTGVGSQFCLKGSFAKTDPVYLNWTDPTIFDSDAQKNKVGSTGVLICPYGSSSDMYKKFIKNTCPGFSTTNQSCTNMPDQKSAIVYKCVSLNRTSANPSGMDANGRLECNCVGGQRQHPSNPAWCISATRNCLLGTGLNKTFDVTKPSSIETCVACGANEVSPGGFTVCQSCPANSQPNTYKSECVCKTGYIGTPPNCTQCQAGSYTNTTTNTCEQCPIGKYSDTAGAAECSSCPATKYQDEIGQTNCKACPENSACATGGSDALTTGLTTFRCKPGYQKDGNACNPCEVGTYESGGVCKPCPTGTTTSSTGSTSIQQCVAKTNYYGQPGTEAAPCPINSTSAFGSITASDCTCDSGFYPVGTICAKCPIDGVKSCDQTGIVCNQYYEVFGTGISQICTKIPCRTDQWTPDKTGVQPSCQPCPDNATCDGTNFTCPPNYAKTSTGCSLKSCANDSYSATGLEPCNACKPGFSTGGEGAKSQSECKKLMTISELLGYLNYTPVNQDGQYYGLTSKDLLIQTSQMLSETDLIPSKLDTFVKPSLVTQKNINSKNPSPYNLTDSNGYAVSPSGTSKSWISGPTIPSGGQGSTESINSAIVSCTGQTIDTCTLRYVDPKTGDITTSNPCTALNAWYNFDLKKCVDSQNNPVTQKVTCQSPTIYDRSTNSCKMVTTYFDQLPTNTIGTPGPDDIEYCIAADAKQCQPIYRIGNTTYSTNPCVDPTPIYDFTANSCKTRASSVNETCCTFSPEVASTRTECKEYIESKPQKNSAMCTKPYLCCQDNNSKNEACIQKGFWKMIPNFKQGACVPKSSSYPWTGNISVATK